MKKLFALFLLFLSCLVYADGLQGMSYVVYQAGGPSPSISTSRRVLDSGTVSTVNFNWCCGILNSGTQVGVEVHFTGYLKVPTTGTYYFGVTTDDGAILTINNVNIVNAWYEQGATFHQGTVNLTAGQIVPVDLWYYQNGGGAVIQFYWYQNGWQIVPSSVLATTSTYWVPALCCGGSSAPFNANSVNVNMVNSFANRTTNDSQVYIQQVGDNNKITVDQEGTKNNYTYILNSGSSNTFNVNQTGNINTQTNYSYNYVNGSYNNVTVTQTSTGGAKGAFTNIQSNNNNVTVSQTDSGSHYAEIGLTGGNKTVNVSQSGSASQMAAIQLSGNPTSLTLQQSGATQNFYSIQFNCATAGGCAAISVKQGQ